MNLVRILGAGPAGSCAALAALRDGASVEIVERSQFPRHKVCGEFLSPEIGPVLDRLGLYEEFTAAKPHRVARMSLIFGSKVRSSLLSEPAYGLSRYAFDHLLWSKAIKEGATQKTGGDVQVRTTGRPASKAARGSRLFGFKAHFVGPPDDAVELYFLTNAYVGINCVEGGITNVCGLAPESILDRSGFEPEALLHRSEALRERLHPLTRSTKWHFTGPLTYAQHWDTRDAYLAGDALSFVDPFTGSGLLTAALTGSLAGSHAARDIPIDEHIRRCRAAIGRPFVVSSLLRAVAGTSWAERLAVFVPARLLFHLTRPAART